MLDEFIECNTHYIRVVGCITTFNSGGIYDIVYETGTRGNQSSCTGAWAFDNFNIKTWGRNSKRLDEEFIERSET